MMSNSSQSKLGKRTCRCPGYRDSMHGLCFVIAFLFPLSAFAQRQAGRTLGQPIQVQPGPSRAATGGTSGANPMGAARFLRENRSRRDFVGSNRSDLTGFVGNRQALGVGQVVQSTASLPTQKQSATRLNPPLPPLAAKAIYYPRLVLDNLQDPGRAEQRAEEIFSRLANRIEMLSDGEVTIVQDGHRVVLQGVVRTRAESDRLVALVSFEPGIDAVENQLVVGDERLP